MTARAGQLGDDRDREPHGHGCAAVLVQPDAARPPAGGDLGALPAAASAAVAHGLGHVRDAENRPIANATVTIEGDADHAGHDRRHRLLLVPERARGHLRRDRLGQRVQQPPDAGAGRVGADDARLHALTSDAFGYTCRLEEAAFEQADTVVPLTGDDEVTTIDLPSRSGSTARPSRARTCARTGSWSSWGRRPPTARPAMPRSRPRAAQRRVSTVLGRSSSRRHRSGPTCEERPTGAS